MAHQSSQQSQNQGELTVVLGGTGKTGRRVSEGLAAKGVPVRIAGRNSAPPFDWNDQATWSAVLDGAAACYIAFYPDLAFPGAVDTVGALAKQAAQAGVRRLVLLSGRGEPEAQRAEAVIASVGVEWTVVRSAWFAQNFSEHFLLPAVLEGVITLPTGSEIAEPFVDLDDLAAVAVAALTEPGHAGQIYEVTGPRLLTFADTADEISRATGRAVTFQPVPPDAFGEEALRSGVPADEVEELIHLFSEVLDGHNAYITDGVQRALGRPPRDFAEYARNTAATGVWDTEETR
jgi:uncharacterized protein YbjT (DUF2867 family)